MFIKENLNHKSILKHTLVSVQYVQTTCFGNFCQAFTKSGQCPPAIVACLGFCFLILTVDLYLKAPKKPL